MRLFGGSKGRSSNDQSDRILTADQVEEVLADDYGPVSDAVIVIYDMSKPMPMVISIFLPLVQEPFSTEPKLGMLYGIGTGVALIRQAALKKVQAASSRAPIGEQVRSCGDLIKALERLGYSVREHPQLSYS